MPQLDTEGWNNGSGNRHISEPIIIDGDAIDVTPSVMVDDTEPPFPKDLARDREGTLAESPFGLIPYGPVRALRAESLHSKSNLIEQLTRTIPRNEYDLPEFVYRADMLDHIWVQEQLVKMRAPTSTRSDPSEDHQNTTTPTILSPAQAPESKAQGIQAHLDAAIMRLEYLEGFPISSNGLPFWNQLEFEATVDYEKFIAYLELGPERAMHKLIAWPLDEVKASFHIYYWDIRVRSFDLYRIAHATKIRLHRMLDTEDSHYKKAEKLLNKVDLVLGEFTQDEIKEVGFEKLIKAFAELAKVQRISAGLPANGALAAEEGPKAPTMNVIMQQIAQNSPDKVEELDENLDLLHDNPDTLEIAQEFIIRSQKARPIND